MGITIETFGEMGDSYMEEKEKSTYQVDRLPEKQKAELEKLGLIAKNRGDWPVWSVQKTYFWTQQFPANAVVRIRHEYAPVMGFRDVIFENLQPAIKEGCAVSGRASNSPNIRIRGLSRTLFLNISWN